MKRISLITILLLCMVTIKAQVTNSRSPIIFNKTYSVTSDVGGSLCDGSQLQLKVSAAAKKMPCTISIDDKKIAGYLLSNNDTTNKDNKYLYGFYLPNHKTVTLNIKFYREDNIDKAEIYNQDYLQKLKPCFDRKSIVLCVDN